MCAESSGSASSHHKVQDERDHREYQKQVYQPSCNVKYREAADPRDQQNDEQDCPDAHVFFLLKS
jgi:hypothetical protein